MFGTAGVMRRFESEDWTQFNRISLWVYPDLPGWRAVTARVYLYNDGKVKFPVYQCAMMQNHAWNQVVLEITDLPRDRVTGVKFECRRQGNEPEASDTLTFDIDHLELQQVEPDQYEGWKVAPGRIAFSHTGYQTGTVKKAFASDLAAREFQVISQETGQSVLLKPVQQVKTRLGEFQVMDFSEIREPGSYTIQAGSASSRPFRIDNDVWRETIWKAINFFYVERCGADIPGVHRICHRDLTVEHNGKRIVINGGWHDAGDLCQGLHNTAETVYAMFALAEKLKARTGEDALYRRLIEEAKWGLDWIDKTSFGDGYRSTWVTMGLWTNGILGDYDDITARAQNSPSENFQAAAAEALGARVLRQSDPDLAAYNLRLARADFRFATQAPRERGAQIELASLGVLAAVDLYRATGEQPYRDEALRMASAIVNSQQRSFLPGLEVPITGFFYTGPEKESLLHYNHIGHEQAPVVALAKLCETFPEHPDWMKWYSGVVLHSQFFQQAMSQFTEPFRMLPNSIHKADEYLKAREEDRENVRQQVLNGFPVGGDYYVRAYAVQPQGSFRGNYGTMLSQAKAISTAAHLRGDLDLAQLSEDQLHWVVGRNPFGQSTMYGEGYDYQPQYSAMSGEIVGSLPVGIMSRKNYDAPYWPAENYPTHKEVFVHPVARWLWLMADLAGPAIVEGQVPPNQAQPVEFHLAGGGRVVEAKPDFATGRFRIMLPEGEYEVRRAGLSKRIALLPAGEYWLDLRPEHALNFEVSARTDSQGQVVIKVSAQGSGRHRFVLRAENLAISGQAKEVTLAAGEVQAIEWRAAMTVVDAPWVAMVVPDDDLLQRREAFGSTRGR